MVHSSSRSGLLTYRPGKQARREGFLPLARWLRDQPPSCILCRSECHWSLRFLPPRQGCPPRSSGKRWSQHGVTRPHSKPRRPACSHHTDMGGTLVHLTDSSALPCPRPTGRLCFTFPDVFDCISRTLDELIHKMFIFLVHS